MINMKILLTMAVFMLTIGSLVQANTPHLCLNNATLQRSYNYSITMDDSNMNITVVKQQDCQYGCDNVTNTCSPDPVERNMIFAGGMMALMLIIGAIIRQWGGR